MDGNSLNRANGSTPLQPLSSHSFHTHLPSPHPFTCRSHSSSQEELSQLREVFPQLPEASLRRALLRASSLETAVEQLLQGFEH